MKINIKVISFLGFAFLPLFFCPLTKATHYSAHYNRLKSFYCLSILMFKKRRQTSVCSGNDGNSSQYVEEQLKKLHFSKLKFRKGGERLI